MATPGLRRHNINREHFFEVSEIRNQVDIVVVTYNCRHFLTEFFATLRDSTAIPFSVIMIDNASSDQTRSYLKRIRNRAQSSNPIRSMKLIYNPNNLGVAKAWNQGINAGTGAYVVFVNPDLKFSPGWLEGLVHCAEHDPIIGVVGAKIVNFENIIDHAGFIRGVVRGRGENGDCREYDREMEVDGIHGCCFLIKREILAKVGNFDERFFLYAEEDDFCIRVRQAGFRVFYSPIKIYHFSAGSAIPFSKRRRLHGISLEKFYKKWGI